MMRRLLTCLLVLLWVALPGPARAHWADMAVAEMTVADREIRIVLTFPTNLVKSADDSHDGHLDGMEVQQHQTELASFFRGRIRFEDSHRSAAALATVAKAVVAMPCWSHCFWRYLRHRAGGVSFQR